MPRGRPKGSKNKPKTMAPTIESSSDVLGNAGNMDQRRKVVYGEQQWEFVRSSPSGAFAYIQRNLGLTTEEGQWVPSGAVK